MSRISARILAATFFALLATTAACSSSSPEESPAPAPAQQPSVRLEGLYQSTTADGSIAVIEFRDDSHYRAWRFGGGPCASLAPGEAAPESCAEVGTYALSKDVLSLTEDRTGAKTSFAFKVSAFVGERQDGSLTKPSSLEPQADGIVGGGQQLVAAGQPTVAQKVQLTGQDGKSQELVKPSTKGMLCRAACWGVAGIGATAVTLVCAAGTAITIGGVAVPCTVAILAAAGAAGAGASLCSDAICPQ